MKQRILMLLSVFLCAYTYAQNSEFIFIEHNHFVGPPIIRQDGLYYSLLKEPSDNNTFGQALCLVGAGHIAPELPEPEGDLIIPTVIQNGDGDFADKYRVVYIDALFNDCEKITSVTFPDNIRGVKVARVSFTNTKQLKRIIFKTGIPRLRLSAIDFKGSGIEHIYIHDQNPPKEFFSSKVEHPIFTTDVKIHVPVEAIENYMNDPVLKMYNIIGDL